MTVINCAGTKYLEIKEKRYLIDSARTVYLDFNKLTLSVVCLSARGQNTSVTYEILFPSNEKIKECAISIITQTSAALRLNMHRIIPSIHETSKRKTAEISFEFPTPEDVKKFELIALPRILGETFEINSHEETVKLSLSDSSQKKLIERVNTILRNLNKWIEGNIVQKNLSKQADPEISIPEYKSELQVYGKTTMPFRRCFIDATSRFHPIPKSPEWVTPKRAEESICGRTRAELIQLRDSLVQQDDQRLKEGELSAPQMEDELKREKPPYLAEIDRVLSLNREPTFPENNEISRLLVGVSLSQEGEPSHA